MQVRKQRRQLITRLEKTREECLEAKAHFLTALAADPWDENRRGEEFRIWYDRRHKTIDPLAQQAGELEEKTFLGFAELVGVAPGRMKDFAHKARRLSS